MGQLVPQRLRDVHRIFVDSFGQGDGADLVRSKVISRLTKSGRFQVVQAPEQADAILTAVSQISATQHSFSSSTPQYASASSGTRYHATAGVQLIAKDKQILWADDVSSSVLSRSATSGLAEKIVNDLTRASAKDAKSQ